MGLPPSTKLGCKVPKIYKLFDLVLYLEVVNMEWEKDNTLLDWYNNRSGFVKVPVDHMPGDMKLPFSIVDPTIFVDAFFMLNFNQEVLVSPNSDFYPDYET